MEMLEERDRQVFPRPRAASSSAAAFPFVSGVSAFVWDGIQKIGKSLFDFTFRPVLWTKYQTVSRSSRYQKKKSCI